MWLQQKFMQCNDFKLDVYLYSTLLPFSFTSKVVIKKAIHMGGEGVVIIDDDKNERKSRLHKLMCQ